MLAKALVIISIAGVFIISIYFLSYQESTENIWKDTFVPLALLIVCGARLLFYLGDQLFKNEKNKYSHDVFNKNHPERQEDEVFITNADKEEFKDFFWKTKRMGIVAYTLHGKKIPRSRELFPVFVKIRELKSSKKGEILLKKLLP